MKVTFLGTGTSMGVPVAGGFGHYSTDPRDFRYRCAAWLQTGSSSILIDIGPEFRLQTLRAGIKQIDLILITHEHNDHVAGIDDLRPFNYHQGAIPVLTMQRCIDSLMRRYDYMFEPAKVPGSTDVDLMPIHGSERFRDDLITPLPVKHGTLDILGFRVNDFSYITDASFIPHETIEAMRGSEVVVLSGLRWEPPHPTHMTIPEAVRVANEIGARQTYLIHMSSHVVHAEVERRLPAGVSLAYDGLEVEW